MVKIRAIIKSKVSKLFKFKADSVADLLTILAFFIVSFTTFSLNKYVGMYVMAAELFILSYFIAK